jgi:hypothetical protein
VAGHLPRLHQALGSSQLCKMEEKRCQIPLGCCHLNGDWPVLKVADHNALRALGLLSLGCAASSVTALSTLRTETQLVSLPRIVPSATMVLSLGLFGGQTSVALCRSVLSWEQLALVFYVCCLNNSPCAATLSSPGASPLLSSSPGLHLLQGASSPARAQSPWGFVLPGSPPPQVLSALWIPCSSW